MSARPQGVSLIRSVQADLFHAERAILTAATSAWGTVLAGIFFVAGVCPNFSIETLSKMTRFLSLS